MMDDKAGIAAKKADTAMNTKAKRQKDGAQKEITWDRWTQDDDKKNTVKIPRKGKG